MQGNFTRRFRTIIDRAALGYNRVEIEDFTHANPDSIYHAVLRGIDTISFSIQIASDSDRNSAAMLKRAAKGRLEGGSGNERSRIRRNYAAKLHGAINPRALIVTSLRNRKLSAIDGKSSASSGRNEIEAERHSVAPIHFSIP